MIAIAPPRETEIQRYSTWLNKRGFSFRFLSREDSLRDTDRIFMLCGGPDVGSNLERDLAETNWFREAIAKNIPVLGICRGMQLSNFIMGGTLYEDLSSNPVKHTSTPRQVKGKTVKDSSFHSVICENESFIVNSRHHQAVKDLAKELVSMGVCSRDNVCEMAGNDTMLLVQWHPEKLEVWNTAAETKVSDWIKNKIG